ncbi:MAG: formimidoylglutamate deiminase [Pyrinomonadaceae bacterium]|nr:formimidoylglutamate deiminase [Pyrinomonadaceae bacterium]
MNGSDKTLWLPDLTYRGGQFEDGFGVACDDGGKIVELAIAAPELTNTVRLTNRALLPGLVNAHSHAFQRVIRGRTEYHTSNEKDSFWTWREMMYSAATRLTPEAIYDASRMAFLEMALSGITAVGEFHYIHNQPDGTPYDDPNLLAREVVRAARDVGLRIALLRVAYARAGFETGPNPRQARFIEAEPDVYLDHFIKLRKDLAGLTGQAWVGVAPHSVRAVPLNYLKEVVRFGNEQGLPIHMHLAEQPAEVSACIEEYGRSPVALLETEGLLSERFTGVHVIHITPKAAHMLGQTGAMVCACPTTERNLGDGIVPVDKLFEENVRVSLGTDSQIQIDLLEDARELEYHLRLQKKERVVLTGRDRAGQSDLASKLFECATINGAQSINAPGGKLESGLPADFFTVDLNDPSIVGASKDDLLSSIVFSLSRPAVKDVVVDGKRIVEDGRHAAQDEIVERFSDLQKKLWG